MNSVCLAHSMHKSESKGIHNVTCICETQVHVLWHARKNQTLLGFWRRAFRCQILSYVVWAYRVGSSSSDFNRDIKCTVVDCQHAAALGNTKIYNSRHKSQSISSPRTRLPHNKSKDSNLIWQRKAELKDRNMWLMEPSQFKLWATFAYFSHGKKGMPKWGNRKSSYFCRVDANKSSSLSSLSLYQRLFLSFRRKNKHVSYLSAVGTRWLWAHRCEEVRHGNNHTVLCTLTRTHACEDHGLYLLPREKATWQGGGPLSRRSGSVLL